MRRVPGVGSGVFSLCLSRPTGLIPFLFRLGGGESLFAFKCDGLNTFRRTGRLPLNPPEARSNHPPSTIHHPPSTLWPVLHLAIRRRIW